MPSTNHNNISASLLQQLLVDPNGGSSSSSAPLQQPMVVETDGTSSIGSGTASVSTGGEGTTAAANRAAAPQFSTAGRGFRVRSRDDDDDENANDVGFPMPTRLGLGRANANAANTGPFAGLRALTMQTEMFLKATADAPPAVPISEGEVFPEMEAEENHTNPTTTTQHAQNGPSGGGQEGENENFNEEEEGDEAVGPSIEMNLVLGVLEPQLKTVPEGATSAGGGVLLPTPATLAAVERQQNEDALRMLQLVTSLSHPSTAQHRRGGGGDDDDSSSGVDEWFSSSSDDGDEAPHAE